MTFFCGAQKMRGRIEEIRQTVERHLMSTFLSLYVYYTVRDTIKTPGAEGRVLGFHS